MTQSGLLRRLSRGDRARNVEAEILDHLRVLLNARQGESATVPQFGVMDFSDVVHALPRGMQSVEDTIRITIERFEPRLVDVRVRGVPEELSLVLHFEITARLRDDPSRILRVRTRVVSGGRFFVEGG